MCCTNFSSSLKLLTLMLHWKSFLFGLVGWASSASFKHPPTTARARSTVRIVASRFPTSFLHWNSTFVLFTNLIPQGFRVVGLSFLSLSTSTPSIGFMIWTFSPFLFVSSGWSMASKQMMSFVTWAENKIKSFQSFKHHSIRCFNIVADVLAVRKCNWVQFFTFIHVEFNNL